MSVDPQDFDQFNVPVWSQVQHAVAEEQQTSQAGPLSSTWPKQGRPIPLPSAVEARSPSIYRRPGSYRQSDRSVCGSENHNRTRPRRLSRSSGILRCYCPCPNSLGPTIW